jgi:hypothetical protein
MEPEKCEYVVEVDDFKDDVRRTSSVFLLCLQLQEKLPFLQKLWVDYRKNMLGINCTLEQAIIVSAFPNVKSVKLL